MYLLLNPVIVGRKKTAEILFDQRKAFYAVIMIYDLIIELGLIGT